MKQVSCSGELPSPRIQASEQSVTRIRSHLASTLSKASSASALSPGERSVGVGGHGRRVHACRHQVVRPPQHRQPLGVVSELTGAAGLGEVYDLKG